MRPSPAPDPSTWEAWSRTRFHLPDPGALGPFLAHHPGPWVIVTAWNPGAGHAGGAVAVTPDENLARDQALEGWLREAGRPALRIVGRAPPPETHAEPGWLVPVASLDEAVALGAAWKQDGVYLVQPPDTLILAWCAPGEGPPPRELGSFRARLLTPPGAGGSGRPGPPGGPG
jgi:hypothetical protein